MFPPMCVISGFIILILLMFYFCQIFEPIKGESYEIRQKRLYIGVLNLSVLIFLVITAILGFIYYNDLGDKRAIESGVMRWESDKDGNLSRVWINQQPEKKQ